ncbi:LysR family transcriptional regulator [uncultured Pseudacidovorax sp.]|uniref:LysR family transcriptional regulator n=1 Tax=uncultured Pseudacidovorax sp. TaxID=679313 RepID=UPI0025E555D8|nr:LysR family transcriptional regulator [uncultured Pseudacidovorax sp.]
MNLPPSLPERGSPLLDLRRVRQFVVLAETLNFRRAAERLHMAQPPLSVSIQKLESEVGTRLFERGGSGGVTLTPSGHAALAEARRLLFQSGRFCEAATAAAQGMGGALRVGFVGSTTSGVLQRVVRLFRAEYSAVELVLKESTSVGILEQVESGALDVGLVRTPLMVTARVALSSLLSEPFVVALPAAHPLARSSELRLDELAQESFVFYGRGDAAGLHAMAMLACQLAGFLPRVSQEATQVQTILSLVESDLGVALVPSIMRDAPNPRIAYRDIIDYPAAAGLGLAVVLSTDRPVPAAQRFRDIAAQAQALAPHWR